MVLLHRQRVFVRLVLWLTGVLLLWGWCNHSRGQCYSINRCFGHGSQPVNLLSDELIVEKSVIDSVSGERCFSDNSMNTALLMTLLMLA